MKSCKVFLILITRHHPVTESLQSFELWRQRNLLVVRELLQRRIFRPNHVDLISDPHIVFVHQLNVFPFLQRIMNYKFLVRPTSYINYLGLLRFQLVFLFDPLDATTRCIATVFKCSPTLLHSHDLVAVESAKLEGSIEVSHGD